MSTRNGYHGGNGSDPAASSGNDLLAQVQATTRLILETQQVHSRVLERYLEMQERVILHATQGAPLPPPLAPAPPTRIAPAPVKPPVVPVPASLLTASPRLTVTPAANGPAKNGRVESAARPAPSPAPAPAPQVAEGPPSVEQFRKDLLEAVSARTGYPTDVLDETLHLEAALGIDSIKTVEIYSSLKPYHPYFPGAGSDQEEQLAKFIKLKTLRDIVNTYDHSRQAYLAGAHAGKPAVERHEVVAAPAPAEVGSKKNSLTAASSSSSERQTS
jgi:hypothetical protein